MQSKQNRAITNLRNALSETEKAAEDWHGELKKLIELSEKGPDAVMQRLKELAPVVIPFGVSKNWKVQRHGGHRNNIWRQVFEGSELDAGKVYQKHITDMRQGGVRLLDPNGKVVFGRSAPGVRTVW